MSPGRERERGSVGEWGLGERHSVLNLGKGAISLPPSSATAGVPDTLHLLTAPPTFSSLCLSILRPNTRLRMDFYLFFDSNLLLSFYLCTIKPPLGTIRWH